MNVNNVELEIDFFDLETSEKYEKALNKVTNSASKVQQKVEKEKKGMTFLIKTQCELIFDFFDEIFGEGTSLKIFGKKTNLRVCMDAFATILQEYEKQTSETVTYYQNLVSDKYSKRIPKR